MTSIPIKIGKETIYSVEDVADAYKVSPATIRTLLRVGLINGIKLDRRWFIVQDEFKRVRKAIPKLGTRGPAVGKGGRPKKEQEKRQKL